MTASSAGEQWLAMAEQQVREDPSRIGGMYVLAGRKVGRAPSRPDDDPRGIVHGSVDDAARAALVRALVETTGAHAAPALAELYDRGDSAERRGVLRGLDAIVRSGQEPPPEIVAVGVARVRDALRANESSLVAAAVGPFAAVHLDQHAWRHAVLKLVFMEISLDAVANLEVRRDHELARMARDFAAERRAAGRSVPQDLVRLTAEGSA